MQSLTKAHINRYISKRRREQGKQTLEAIYSHFLDGLPVADAAKSAGISRQLASSEINAIAKRLEKNGYVRVNRVYYVKRR